MNINTNNRGKATLPVCCYIVLIIEKTYNIQND